MRKFISLLSVTALAAFFCVGCAGPEEKMGRGLLNLTEPTRLTEFEHAELIESTYNGADIGAFTGFVRGVDRTFARTGMGIYEVVTFPFPPYRPVLTDYVSARAEGYHPRKWSDAMFDNDRQIGFSGGDVAPWFPGSRFRIFDN